MAILADLLIYFNEGLPVIGAIIARLDAVLAAPIGIQYK